jgi:hypothetical protein
MDVSETGTRFEILGTPRLGLRLREQSPITIYHTVLSPRELIKNIIIVITTVIVTVANKE